MINKHNPWEKMPNSSQRRIDNKSVHNIFWITDIEGKYGFYLVSEEVFQEISNSVKLKGISVLKRNNKSKGELFLILTNKEDWEIFYSLCSDLVSITHKFNNEHTMITAVENRLKRWQHFLKQDRNIYMSLERQMGLFSELSSIIDFLSPNVGIANSIISWVGADFDKQDFLLTGFAIEVKSYRTSKSPIVTISSAQQLFSEKKHLYLLTYGLTQSIKGKSIKYLVEKIIKLLEFESFEVQNLFEAKLYEYGYFPDFDYNLFSFIVDKTRLFYVSDDFPKIIPAQLKNEIVSLKYSIDLSKCLEFEKSFDFFWEVNND